MGSTNYSRGGRVMQHSRQKCQKAGVGVLRAGLGVLGEGLGVLRAGLGVLGEGLRGQQVVGVRVRLEELRAPPCGAVDDPAGA